VFVTYYTVLILVYLKGIVFFKAIFLNFRFLSSTQSIFFVIRSETQEGRFSVCGVSYSFNAGIFERNSILQGHISQLQISKQYTVTEHMKFIYPVLSSALSNILLHHTSNV